MKKLFLILAASCLMVACCKAPQAETETTEEVVDTVVEVVEVVDTVYVD